VSEETFYASDGALVYKTDSTYNDAGNLLEQKNSSSDSNDVGKVSCEYDSQGNLIKRTKFSTDVLKRPYIYIEHYIINYY
jgi:hypothetical protein